MKKLFILTIITILFSCNSNFKVIEKPTEYSEVIKRREIIGVLFSEKGGCYMCFQNRNRFSPNLTEIKIAEKILYKNIREINYRKINQGSGCPIIHNNLHKYKLILCCEIKKMVFTIDAHN